MAAALDRTTGQWSSLTKTGNTIGYSAWSRDGKYVYFNLNDAPNICRVRLSDHAVETVTVTEGLPAEQTLGRWSGFTDPGNSGEPPTPPPF
jgi:hypothetical protein